MDEIEKRIAKIESRVEGLEKEVRALKNTVSLLTPIGPPGGLWPHEEKGLDRAAEKTAEDFGREIEIFKKRERLI